MAGVAAVERHSRMIAMQHVCAAYARNLASMCRFTEYADRLRQIPYCSTEQTTDDVHRNMVFPFVVLIVISDEFDDHSIKFC